MQDIFELARSAQGLGSIDELNTLMGNYFDSIGFDKYAYVIVNNPTNIKMNNFYVSNYPSSWEDRYTTQNYFNVDPLYNLFENNNQPFSWRADDLKNENCNRQRTFFKEASDFKITHGMGVPIFMPTGGFAIMSLCTDNLSQKDLDKYLRKVKKDIFAASHIHHSATIGLTCDIKQYDDFNLTERELETLYWLCQNKTYVEIGMILNVGREGVSERLRKVYTKMGAIGRLDAVKKAIRFGIIKV